jgi:hypothetical protein
MDLKMDRSQVQLLPGVNDVADNEWLVMKPHLAAEIKSGVITAIEKEVKKSAAAPDGRARNLKQLPVMNAVALVGETVNPDTLNRWYQKEARQEVRLAIVERMKELKIEIPKFAGAIESSDPDEGNPEDKR